jgi:serine/threonine protein kinase
MGEVWKAFDPALSRHVAIKILSPEYSLDSDRLRRFEQEARAAGMLNHPNVLSIFAIGKQDDSPYLVTELLEGVTLRHRLGRGAIPEDQAIAYADQISQGLAAAHAKGIVHRDLKPENIFITDDDRVKILDFGIAKLHPERDAEEKTQTATGLALGTPAYMSPEQVRGQAADYRSDIFALGAVLYEMLAGRRPFARPTTVETMNAILNEPPPAVPGISPQVEQIVRHCLEKEPAVRYQSARDLGFHLRLARQASARSPLASLTRPSRRAFVATILGLTMLAATAALTWWLTRPVPQTPAPTFTRLTSDSGLTTDPTFSKDGQLIAYASDRAGTGNLDIWRHQLATGEAIRLTSDPADESEPAFSPDGSRIAFRSERDGGGIYVVSAFGGPERLIAKHGRRPRFSPDGSEIAYWAAASPWYLGKVFVAPAIGGAPAPIEPAFASARYPIWSADGKALLFLGARDPKDISTFTQDWWLVPRHGGPSLKTGALEILRRQGVGVARQMMSLIAPADWIDDQVFFSSSTEQSTNVWRVTVPPETGKAEGSAERLTSGTSVESKPSVISGGRIAFASLKEDLNIWSLPITGNSGRVTGDLQQVTAAAFDAHTSLSADGRKLVFISTRSGSTDVWMKDLESGKETALTNTPIHKEQAEITGDGTRVCYGTLENSTFAIYEIPVSGGIPERLCVECGRPWDWSPDGTKLLYLIPEGYRQPGLSFGMVDRTTREKSVYLEHPEYSLGRARFAPDGRWIAFMTADRKGGYRIVVAPFLSGGAPPDRWITIAEEARVSLDKPRWSPDGNLLYYVSEADGFRCIRARRLNPLSKHPIGDPFDVFHSHSARRSLMNAWFGSLEISVTRNRLFLNLGETTGNIWMADTNEATAQRRLR